MADIERKPGAQDLPLVDDPERLREQYRREMRKIAEDFCRESGYVLSPIADQVIEDFVNMKVKYGDFYCPCQVDSVGDDQTICVCAPVRNGLVDIEGACFCYFFLKKPE